jgi:hypothetical protein
MLNAFIGKFSKDQRKELEEQHGVMWEEDENVSQCRECEKKFSVAVRKHHCRGCGGIFCDTCAVTGVLLEKTGAEPVRACSGCRRGETPGEGLLHTIERALNAEEGKGRFPPAQPIPVRLGSLYGDNDSRAVRLDGEPAHRYGYFEIVNKSSEMMAVKLIEGGSDSLREICRPSYLAGKTSELSKEI